MVDQCAAVLDKRRREMLSELEHGRPAIVREVLLALVMPFIEAVTTLAQLDLDQTSATTPDTTIRHRCPTEWNIQVGDEP